MPKTPEYARLENIEVVGIRLKSILIKHPHRKGKIVTIGRSCLHSFTDDRLDEYNTKRISLPVVMGRFQVFKWLAEKEGLIQNVEPKSSYPRADDADESELYANARRYLGEAY